LFAYCLYESSKFFSINFAASVAFGLEKTTDFQSAMCLARFGWKSELARKQAIEKFSIGV